MVKFFQIALVIALVGVCTAHPQRFRNLRANRFSARQEVAPDSEPGAKAPYPPAGIKPDLPFDLPTETTTTQPDNTYLPPEGPDNTYGPPPTTLETETEVPEVLIEDDDDTESVISVAVSYDNDNSIASQESQRIIFGQRVQPLKSGKMRAVRAEPIFLDDRSFTYSAQVQNW